MTRVNKLEIIFIKIVIKSNAESINKAKPLTVEYNIWTEEIEVKELNRI